MRDKITQMPGTQPTQKSFAENVVQMQKEMEALLAFTTMKASLTRHAYMELKSLGFSKAEALELCTKIS